VTLNTARILRFRSKCCAAVVCRRLDFYCTGVFNVFKTPGIQKECWGVFLF